MDWRLKDREPGSTNFLVSSTLTKSKIGWGGVGGGGTAHGRPHQHLEKFSRVEQQKSEIEYPGASNSNNNNNNNNNNICLFPPFADFSELQVGSGKDLQTFSYTYKYINIKT